MVNFPGSLDDTTSLPDPGTGNFTDNPSHATLHDLENAAIRAIEAKVGVSASTPVANRVFRGTGTGSSAWAQLALATDVTGTLPVANGGTGGTTAAAAAANLATEVGKLLFPVGSIYISIISTNPGTSLGFGTWVAYGAGQTMIGVGTSDQVFAAAATGGESNHTLTGAESGTSVHGHGVTDPQHTHTTTNNAFNNSDTPTTGTSNGLRLTSTANANLSITVANSSTGLTVNNSSAANASSAHNNLPPYIVTYFWKRTA